jgi:glutamyl-tRNA synthetase
VTSTSGSLQTRPVRVRIAPSPTGDPHVGTAYIGLFNYAFARHAGGKFVLRIEDTDRTRFRADSEQMIVQALRWVGLDWDEGPDVGGPFGPYRQSERTAIYRDHAQILLDRGTAYRCFCSEDRLAKLRIQQHAEKRPHLGYDRHCRSIAPAESAKRAASEPFVIRLAMPTDGTIVVRDRLRGDVARDAIENDDQVLLKSDGMPTYHLANVVDDHLMEISHVVRAEEWLSSTPKHVVLYQAFGWEAPEFIHMPLLRNADKSKISKRKNPVSINFYRDLGILPCALLNYLGQLGWSFGGDRERFTFAEMVEVFSWDRVSLGGPVFDLVKLTNLNAQYLHELTPAQLAGELAQWRLSRDMLERVVGIVQRRVKTLSEVVPAAEYFFSGDLDHAALAGKLVVPDVAPAAVGAALEQFVERFEAKDGFTAKMLEDEANAWTEALGWKKKHSFSLLRVAVTGRTETPGLFDVMAVIGKELTRRRLRRAAEVLQR